MLIVDRDLGLNSKPSRSRANHPPNRSSRSKTRYPRSWARSLKTSPSAKSSFHRTSRARWYVASWRSVRSLWTRWQPINRLAKTLGTLSTKSQLWMREVAQWKSSLQISGVRDRKSKKFQRVCQLRTTILCRLPDRSSKPTIKRQNCLSRFSQKNISHYRILHRSWSQEGTAKSHRFATHQNRRM